MRSAASSGARPASRQASASSGSRSRPWPTSSRRATARQYASRSSTTWPMVWPEPKLGITIFLTRQERFLLPSMPDAAVRDLPEFGLPISAAPIPSEDVAPGNVDGQSTWEATTGRFEELTSRCARPGNSTAAAQRLRWARLLRAAGGTGHRPRPSSTRPRSPNSPAAVHETRESTARWAGRTAARWC